MTDHRIAYVTGQYPAVSLTFILREIEALRELGLHVDTCAIRRTPPAQHPGPAEKDEAANTFYVLAAARDPRILLGAQARAFRDPARYFGALRLAWRLRRRGLRALLYQMFFFVEATILARHLERIGTTHIHNHFVSSAAMVTLLASRMTGLPYSLMLHGPADLLEPLQEKLGDKVAHAAFVAAISHFARSQAMLHSDPAHWDRIRIVHCGVRPENYAARPKDPDPDRPMEMIFVGRLAPVKGLRVLFDAMSRLDVATHLTIVGDGPDRAALEAAAAPLGDAVRFTGYMSQAQVAEAMGAADLCVLPSFAEGVPVVLMEALASGVPVLATAVAGVGELVEDGVTGHIVPPGDADALATRITALARDPEGRARMGAAGRAVVETGFDIRTEAARLAALFAGQGGDDPRPAPLDRDAP